MLSLYKLHLLPSGNGTEVLPLINITRVMSVLSPEIHMVKVSQEYLDFLANKGITEEVCKQRTEEILILLHQAGYLHENQNDSGALTQIGMYLPLTLPTLPNTGWNRISNTIECWSATPVTLKRQSKSTESNEELYSRFFTTMRHLIRRLYVDDSIWRMFVAHMEEKKASARPRTTP